jgi:protein ImuB
VTAAHGGIRIVAADPAARAGGIAPGMPLADARALLPDLEVHDTAPVADARALTRLALACTRFTPWTAVDGHTGGFGGDGGLWLDVTGCTHLFGGERELLDALVRRVNGAGFAARAGLADTAGAAWALARFAPIPDGGATLAVAPAFQEPALARLPVAGLRLAPATVEGLHRMGLRRIGDLYGMPRAPLASRFGPEIARRLDQALGRAEEVLSPLRSPPGYLARLGFAEPIGHADDIARGLERLLGDLAAQLEKAGLGARRLEFALHRVDGTRSVVRVGTGRPSRDTAHLMRLFRDRLEALDPGFGVEIMTLAALAAEPQMPAQGDFAGTNAGLTAVQLIDRLAGRLGVDAVTRLTPVASHIPERASREVPMLTTAERPQGKAKPKPELKPARRIVLKRGDDGDPDNADWRRDPPRPLQLLVQPSPIEVMALVPDGPPVLFRWRRLQCRVVRAAGPERIAPEWWRAQGSRPGRAVRDYYRVEDAEGARYWIFREGLYTPDRPPAWYLHGFFA